MVVKTKDIPVYYLNPDFFEERKKQMDEFLDQLGFKYERSPSNSGHAIRQNRINEGFTNLVIRAMEKDEYPFLILEDDARLIKPLPQYVDIPPEAMLIYYGCSLYECGYPKQPLRIEEYNQQYYRLYNSLGCHAILVINQEAAEFFIKKQLEASDNNQYSDIHLAVSTNDHLFLTPKDGPYFYQNDAHTEPITKFLWEDVKQNYLR
jgi:hypothetical protein